MTLLGRGAPDFQIPGAKSLAHSPRMLHAPDCSPRSGHIDDEGKVMRIFFVLLEVAVPQKYHYCYSSWLVAFHQPQLKNII